MILRHSENEILCAHEEITSIAHARASRSTTKAPRTRTSILVRIKQSGPVLRHTTGSFSVKEVSRTMGITFGGRTRTSVDRKEDCCQRGEEIPQKLPWQCCIGNSEFRLLFV